MREFGAWVLFGFALGALGLMLLAVVWMVIK